MAANIVPPVSRYWAKELLWHSPHVPHVAWDPLLCISMPDNSPGIWRIQRIQLTLAVLQREQKNAVVCLESLITSTSHW